MAFSLTWLPAVLEDAGLKVAEVPGWQSRGRAEMGAVLGAMVHHTAGPRLGNMPSLNTLVNGRSDLPGPLANLGLGRDGTWYVIAAGRANHAGAGRWRGEVNGNSNFIGIEGENTGRADDMPWPEVQLRSLVHGVAAMLRHAGRSAEWCCGHKEYALPPGRKIDPLLDLDVLRQQIGAILAGTTPPLALIPADEASVAGGVPGAGPGAGPGPGTSPGAGASPSASASAATPRPTLRRGGPGGDLVKELQKKLGLQPSGDFDAATEAKVREFQRANGLVPDGIVGPKSWKIIGAP